MDSSNNWISKSLFFSFEGADSPTSEDVDDFGDDFEQTLLDNIDGASQKRSVR